jgi:hypothetical protein
VIRAGSAIVLPDFVDAHLWKLFMKTVTRQIQTFMTPIDEEAFSVALSARFPRITFIDDNVWTKESPPTYSAIHLCKSNFVFLWNRDAVPEIRGERREDGMFL